MEPGDHADSYFGLLFDLEELFGRSVDLLEATAIKNRYVRRSIEATKELLYAA
jgi:predicted nucleotidyltransferase